MKIGRLLWSVALSLTVSSGLASSIQLSDSPNLGDVRLEGAVARKMSMLFQEVNPAIRVQAPKQKL